MSDELPASARDALAVHDAVVETDGAFRITTTAFEATVTASQAGDAIDWTVTSTVPSLEAATSDHVGEAVGDGWFETLTRRLADAPSATRADVELADLTVERRGLDVVAAFSFEWDDTARAVEIAKTLVEYVEGTYVASVVPGYSYEPPVSDLLSRADTGGDAQRGGTPL